jgi:hypothetical protein
MLPVGFEPTISAGKEPKTYALESAATGTVFIWVVLVLNLVFCANYIVQVFIFLWVLFLKIGYN